MNVIQYESKIKQLLKRFIQPNCIINEDHYYKFLNQLSGKNTTAKVNITEFPVFIEWIQEAIATWHLNKWTPTTLVASFALNLTAILCREEQKFSRLNKNNFYVKLIRVLNARNADTPSCIHLAYINFLSSILEHKTGIEWTMACNFWEDILKLSLISDNVYIIRESRNFMKKLLKAGIEFDEEFCKDAVKKIMAPLSENAYKSICLGPEYNDQIMYKDLSPTLQLVGVVMEYFLVNCQINQKNFILVMIFLENFNLEHRVSDILILNLNKYLLFDLGRIMFTLQFLGIYIKMMKGDTDREYITCSVKKIVDIFIANILKGNFENVIKFCYFGQFYWNLIASNIPSNLLNVELAWLIDDISLLPLSPLVQVPHIHFLKSVDMRVVSEENSSRVEFQCSYRQLFKPELIQIAIAWRKLFLNQSNLFRISEKSLIYFLKSKKYFQRNRAVLLSKFFVYILKDIIIAVRNNSSEALELCHKETQFFTLLFEVTATFIEYYKITWKDDFIVLGLFEITLDFLTIPQWPMQVVAKLLQLLKICFEFYLSPSLALLVDDSDDTNIKIVRELIGSKLQVDNIEVKKSALEVIMVISQISRKELLSLSKILKNLDIPEMVVQMLVNDNSSYVRIAAIKCLQEMIQVEDVWCNNLISQNLMNKIKQVLITEPEGTVRAEAVTLLCEACRCNKFPQGHLKKIYKTMAHITIADSHWKVKLHSLKFWERVITMFLENQGVTDGNFPKIKFSKEKRRIIKFTESEIKKRLRTALGGLSRNGCLGVLIISAAFSYDIEVTKAANKIIQDFAEWLKRYDIIHRELADSTEVIERILLRMIKSPKEAPAYLQFSPSDDDDEENDEIKNSGHIHNYNTFILPTEFLRLAQQDLYTFHKSRIFLNGVEDLDPLLDNMSKASNDGGDVDDDIDSTTDETVDSNYNC